MLGTNRTSPTRGQSRGSLFIGAAEASCGSSGGWAPCKQEHLLSHCPHLMRGLPPIPRKERAQLRGPSTGCNPLRRITDSSASSTDLSPAKLKLAIPSCLSGSGRLGTGLSRDSPGEGKGWELCCQILTPEACEAETAVHYTLEGSLGFQGQNDLWHCS